MSLSPLSVTSNFMVAQPPTDEHQLNSTAAALPASSRPESVEELQNRILELEQELDLVRMKGKLLSQEVDLFRQRRIVYWSDRFRNTFDAWNLMNPGFQQLKDDSAIFNGSLKGFRLQPSLSLLRVAFQTYSLDLRKPNLKSILLAPVVDVPLTSGELVIRIFEAPDKYITSSVASIADVRDDRPLQFNFSPIANSDKTPLLIRVHVQGVDAPVRIFELRKYGLGGFGRQYNLPFAGYLFD
ncbi:MAG: hypothetical protein EKK48_23170 [Candidatus Melainabacteria bacterium]|nr:MAG: hypothetical protein EKK48_23170 [Candidatus Melainabacteria bacterium]